MKTSITVAILTSLLLTAPSALASLEFQMKNILSHWDFGKGRLVFMIRQQTETKVKIYKCDRTVYLEKSACHYSGIVIGTYNSSFDGFCVPRNGKACNSGIQVSMQYPNELLEIVDPLDLYNYGNQGETYEARKP